mmetsp:Transcript_54594/g.107826  ORF Transcript_54594/g.107826 Transcript_54594/m.107826 type:complete len:209 (-) Transcript_54594:1596-2222(-)
MRMSSSFTLLAPFIPLRLVLRLILAASLARARFSELNTLVREVLIFPARKAASRTASSSSDDSPKSCPAAFQSTISSTSSSLATGFAPIYSSNSLPKASIIKARSDFRSAFPSDFTAVRRTGMARRMRPPFLGTSTLSLALSLTPAVESASWIRYVFISISSKLASLFSMLLTALLIETFTPSRSLLLWSDLLLLSLSLYLLPMSILW